MTRISFIMPTFNRAEYIVESISAIFSQMGTEDELIVVDDGSTENIQGVLAPYLNRLRYIRQSNSGKSIALNRGLDVARGKYVWICDDDDLLVPGSVDLLIETIEETGASMVFGRYTRFCTVNNSQVILGTGYWPDLAAGSVHRHILEDAFIMHNAALVRRDVYTQLGPFDPLMLRSQDYDMFTRIALSCKISYVDKTIFLQRKHSGERGPSSMVHEVGKSNEVWERFDRFIFERLSQLVPLQFFLSLFDGPDKTIVQRAALLQRACILARHGLWREALNDCGRAASASRSRCLHQLEIDICRRMTAGKHGFSGLLEPKIIDAMASLSRETRIGRTIAGEISRGLFWRIKADDTRMRNEALRHLFRVSNLVALASRKIFPCKGLEATYLAERAPDLTTARAAVDRWSSVASHGQTVLTGASRS